MPHLFLKVWVSRSCQPIRKGVWMKKHSSLALVSVRLQQKMSSISIDKPWRKSTRMTYTNKGSWTDCYFLLFLFTLVFGYVMWTDMKKTISFFACILLGNDVLCLFNENINYYRWLGLIWHMCTYFETTFSVHIFCLPLQKY